MTTHNSNLQHGHASRAEDLQNVWSYISAVWVIPTSLGGGIVGSC